jgi:hypothetical protein
MSEKKERKVTPIGEAKWAHLHTPKAPFDAKGAPKFQIDVIFEGVEEWAKWSKDIMDKIRALPDQLDKDGDKIKKQSPIKREMDENDQPTGRFYVTFKTSDKFKPGVFDKFGHPIPETVLIGNGSKVRVSYIENIYPKFGGGINFYLNAVQVIELVEYKAQNAAAYGFDVEEYIGETQYAPTDESGIPF